MRHLIHNQLKADIEENVSSIIPFCNACYKSVIFFKVQGTWYHLKQMHDCSKFSKGTERWTSTGDGGFSSWSQEGGAGHHTHDGVPLQIRSIHYDFYEHGVIFNIRMIVQFSKGTEHWTSSGDVGFSSWSLEGGAAWIRPEGIDHVFHVLLIQQHKGDLLSEWPAE